MKKIISVVLTGALLFAFSGSILADDTTTTNSNTTTNTTLRSQIQAQNQQLQQQRAQLQEQRQELQQKRAEQKQKLEELKQAMSQVRTAHLETLTLRKEVESKRLQVKSIINSLKLSDTKIDSSVVDQIKTDRQAITSAMQQLKGLGEQNEGLWGQFNQARKNKDIDQAKTILQQIVDNLTAKQDQLKQISAGLDKIINDLNALKSTAGTTTNTNTTTAQ